VGRIGCPLFSRLQDMNFIAKTTKPSVKKVWSHIERDYTDVNSDTTEIVVFADNIDQARAKVNKYHKGYTILSLKEFDMTE